MGKADIEISGNLRAETILVEDIESAIYCKACDVLLLFPCNKHDSNIAPVYR